MLLLKRMNRRALQTGAVLLSFLVVVTVVAGCTSGRSSEPGTKTEPTVPVAAQATPGGYSIKVSQGGKAVGSLGLGDLQGLPQVSVQADGKSQQGPTLLSAMKRAGVGEFQKVTVVGLGRERVAEAQLVLTRVQVTDSVVLDINKQGKAKLAGAEIPSERWVIDVSEIRVE